MLFDHCAGVAVAVAAIPLAPAKSVGNSSQSTVVPTPRSTTARKKLPADPWTMSPAFMAAPAIPSGSNFVVAVL